MEPTVVGKKRLLGEHITVEGGRKAITVLHWGSFPIGQYVNKKGEVFLVPNAFTCFTKEAKQKLIGETQVLHADESAMFRFSVANPDPTSEPLVLGEWMPNPTAALDAIHAKIKNKYHREGANGLLVIGVTYPPVQAKIRQKFSRADPLPTTYLAPPSPPPSSFVVAPPHVMTTRRSKMARLCQDMPPRASKRCRQDDTIAKDDEFLMNLELSEDDIDWFGRYVSGNELLPNIPSIVDMEELNHPGMASRMSSTETVPFYSNMSDDEEEPASGIGMVERDFNEEENEEDGDSHSSSWRKKKAAVSETEPTTPTMTTTTPTTPTMTNSEMNFLDMITYRNIDFDDF